MLKGIKRWYNTPFEIDFIDLIVVAVIIGAVYISVNYTEFNVNRCVNAGHSHEYCERGLN